MRRQLADQRDHRGNKRDVVDDRREDGRSPEDRHGGRGRIVSGQGDQLLRRKAQEAGGIDAVHDDEQAEKKEDRDPIDLSKSLGHPERLLFLLAVVLEIVEQHQYRRAEQRDRAGLQSEGPSRDESGDDAANNEERGAHQRQVGDHAALIERHDPRPRFRGRPHVAPPDQMRGDQLRCHDDNDDRRQGDDEIVKAEMRRRADDDVGRIADQGCRAADVRGEHFGEEERVGRRFEQAGDGQCYRRDQQHRRDIVEKGRNNGGHQRQHRRAGGHLPGRRVRGDRRAVGRSGAGGRNGLGGP